MVSSSYVDGGAETKSHRVKSLLEKYALKVKG